MKKALFVAIFALFGLGATFSFASAYETHAPQVKAFNSTNSYVDLSFMAFGEAFKGGTRIALGDFNGDGFDEIAVGAGAGGGPHVRVFDRYGNYVGWDIFPFHKDFRGGVDVAAGDVDGDKNDELIVSQYSQGQAWVKIYKYDQNKTVINSILAFTPSFKGGARVAAGDIDGDGMGEVIVGAGVGGGPHVRAFDADGREVLNFMPFHKDFKGGVDVASGDVDNNGRDEVMVSQNSFGQAWVKTYKADNLQVMGEFLAYDGRFRGGANISTVDLDNDKNVEIITGVAQDGGPHVRAFKHWGQDAGVNLQAYDTNFRGGVDVAAGNLDGGPVKEIATGPGRKIDGADYDYYKYIEVDLSDQTLKYYEGGRKLNEHLISSGLTGATPVGTFTVNKKSVATLMAGPDYYLPGVPYVMSFLGPYTIHGTYWHNNFGHPMSHGCVNMYTPHAKVLYEWADLGTPVVIHP
jgi:lipoprotein-anchoring transpeptidase ErfK/SrfK